MAHLTFRLTDAPLCRKTNDTKPFSLMAIFVTPSLTLCSWHMTRLFTATHPIFQPARQPTSLPTASHLPGRSPATWLQPLLDAHRFGGASAPVISNSDTPETRGSTPLSISMPSASARSVSAKAAIMAGEVIGVLRRDVGRNSGACGAWTSATEHLRPAACGSGLTRAAGFDNGLPSDEHALMPL